MYRRSQIISTATKTSTTKIHFSWPITPAERDSCENNDFSSSRSKKTLTVSTKTKHVHFEAFFSFIKALCRRIGCKIYQGLNTWSTMMGLSGQAKRKVKNRLEYYQQQYTKLNSKEVNIVIFLMHIISGNLFPQIYVYTCVSLIMN